MPPKADTLLSLDRTLYNTWVTYMDFLKSPNSDPTVVADFLDRLADQPDEYLGYTNVPYLEWRTRWMIRLGREQEAVDAWIKGIVYHFRGAHYDEYKKLQDLPLLQQAEKDYFRAHPLSSCDPLVWLEQGPLPVKRRKDYISNTPLSKGDEVCQFTFYSWRHSWGSEDRLATAPEQLAAHPALAESIRKYAQDAYSVHDYCIAREALPSPMYKMPFIHQFLSTYSPETCNLSALLQRAASETGGNFPFIIAPRTPHDSPSEYSQEIEINYCGNGEVIHLLYILKKCGYIDKIFEALPDLPEDFPLLLMCFADTDIRKRVEAYMGISGLADMYDLAFAPRRLQVKEQLKLIEFGRQYPHFQELLGKSLYRYCYHLYNEFYPCPNWSIQEFAHFRCAFCADVLLFLLTAPETLRQMKELLEAGPKMRLQGGSSAYEGFANCQAYFVRNLLGYLALTKDKRLTEWIEAEKGDWKEEAESEHRKIKTLKLVEALQKLE